MKDFIKETLRENMEKNSLGILITKPNQELYIMRGIPGAGKSTKAKSLVGEGVIHSTDNLIEATGDYRGFFKLMNESKNFTPLSQMHSKNLVNAKESMSKGISPVIVDNTNIKQNEAKSYVISALEMGYADKNIKFVDIGTAGLTAEALAERNTHGVPLDKIKAMIASHEAQRPLTLESVLKSKDMYSENKSKVLYSCVLLDKESQSKLLDAFKYKIPEGWKTYAHHMTINMGKLKAKAIIGREVELIARELGMSDKAMAVKVVGFFSTNEIPHITIAVNPNGGKPVMSNKIKDWTPISEIILKGIVTEIKN